MAELATADRTRDGRKVSMLRLVNEISCEAREIRVAFRLLRRMISEAAFFDTRELKS